jgi:drug/metabolite transporter (DMT)-like permease
MIGAFGTTIFFACNAIFANRSAKMLGSTPANFWRLLLAALILGGWAHLAGLGLGGVALNWFLVSGVVGFGLGGVAMFQALPRVGSNLAMLIVQCGSALVAAGGEWIWLGASLTPLQVGFILVALAGVAIGLLPRSLPKVPANVLRVGVTWAIVSAVGQGLGAVLSRKAFMLSRAAHEALDPATTAYQRALGGLLVAAVAVLISRYWPFTVAALYERRNRRSQTAATAEARRAGPAWPWVLANTLAGPVLGVICFQWALSTTKAGIVQSIVATSPLATIPFAAWIEGGWPRPAYYGGALLAVAGVAGLYVFR